MWQCGNPWHFGTGGLQAVQQPHVVTSPHLPTLQPASSPTLARTLSAKFALPSLYTCKPVVSLPLNLWSAISNSLSIGTLKNKFFYWSPLFSTKMKKIGTSQPELLFLEILYLQRASGWLIDLFHLFMEGRGGSYAVRCFKIALFF